MQNLDLHCHSSISDGTLTPEQVIARAKANGVDVISLTDHDEVRGIAQAREAAEQLGIRFVPGVEISITWSGETVHIVGLQIDEKNSSLLKGLAQTRSGRLLRGRAIAGKLDTLGIPDAFDGAMKYVTNPSIMSRKHFARFLVESKVCGSIPQAFDKYLKQGRPAFVPHRWANITDAINWIHRAGGVAVVAHPGRYNFSDIAFSAFLDEFKQLGGSGIEVVTGSHTVDQYKKYAGIATRYGLLASVGSDFHTPGESHIDLGSLPRLPEGVVPVWHNWF